MRPTLVGCLAVIAVLAFGVMFVALLVMGYFLWASNSQPDSKPDRSNTALAEEIEDAVGSSVDGESLRYLSMVCRAVAGKLKDDFASETPIYDSRQELVNLVGIVGYFAMASKQLEKNDALVPLIETLMEDRLGTEGGAIDKKTQDAVVEMFEDLSKAFAEVAG